MTLARPTRRLALAAAVTAACAAGAIAEAHGGSSGTHELRDVRSVSDPKDVNGPLDVASAGFGQVGRDALWTVRTRGSWNAEDLAASPGRRLCLLLRHGAGTTPDSSLCVVRSRHAHPFALRYTELGSEPGGHPRTLHAIVTRKDTRSFTARLAPSDVGLRAGERYRWHVETTWSEPTVCDGAAACTDEAPDAGQVAARLAAVRPVACVASGAHFARYGSRHHRVVALSFDDGPSRYTPRVLRVLEKRHVPGTFFLIGRQIAGGAKYERRALAEGDIVGDHTWDHANVSAGGSATAREISRARAAIHHYLGFDTCAFRAPYNAFSNAEIAEAWRQGLKTVQYDVDPADWARPGADAIYSRVTRSVRPGSIVLMHDGGGPRDQTVAALPRIISYLRAHHYRFATVPELLGLRVVYGRG